MNNYRAFILHFFDCYLDITLSKAYGYVLAANQFQKFYAGITTPDVCAGRFSCTVLDFVDPHTSPALDLSDPIRALAYYPILQHDLTRKMMAGRKLNEYDLIQPTRLALFSPEKIEMTACVCERSEEKNEQAVQSCLFLFAAFLLAERGGLLLHAYGLVIDGLAGAIIGPPDAGKSTAGDLIQKEFILSDDIIGITGIDNQPYAHASPLASSGITDGPGKAPLAALFFPVKSDQFDIRLMLPRDAFLRYLKEHADYIARLMKPIKIRYFDLAYDLFHKVPAYALHFPIDFIDTQKIREVMAQGRAGGSRGKPNNSRQEA